MDSGRRIVVGVNDFTEGDDGQTPILKIGLEVEREQVDRLAGVRARRDGAEVEAALAALREAAGREGENLMPHLITCARAWASEGEVVESLQEVFGSFTEQPVF